MGELANRWRRAYYTITPPWLHRGDGELLLYAAGVILDAFAERSRQGLLARFPQRGHESTLAYHGRDRQLFRGKNESAASYASRLIRWRYPRGHRVRGNPFALCDQIRAYFAPLGEVRVRTVDRRGNWYSTDYDGTESYLWNQGDWDWDGVDVGEWSRYWVVVYTDRVWSTPLLGDPDLWDGFLGSPGHLLGGTFEASDVDTLKSICKTWRPAGTTPEWLITTNDPDLFVPGQMVMAGDWGTWGAGGREPNASYFEILN